MGLYLHGSTRQLKMNITRGLSFKKKDLAPTKGGLRLHGDVEKLRGASEVHACTTNVVIREAITAQPCMWRKEVDGGISKNIKEGEG